MVQLIRTFFSVYTLFFIFSFLRRSRECALPLSYVHGREILNSAASQKHAPCNATWIIRCVLPVEPLRLGAIPIVSLCQLPNWLTSFAFLAKLLFAISSEDLAVVGVLGLINRLFFISHSKLSPSAEHRIPCSYVSFLYKGLTCILLARVIQASTYF